MMKGERKKCYWFKRTDNNHLHDKYKRLYIEVDKNNFFKNWKFFACVIIP